MAEEVSTRHFPAGLGGRRPKRRPQDVFLETGPLTDEDINAMVAHVESGEVVGVKPVDLKQVRQSHHFAAQLLATGMSVNDVARATNYTAHRISTLRNSPAFQELEAFYAEQQRDELADFISKAKILSDDILQEIQRRLDEEPEKITPQMLNEFLKTISDRAGYAPVAKQMNLNIHADFGSRLQAARDRLKQHGGT
jgi:hypothetical protein